MIKIIADKIKLLRVKHNMTQTELYKKLEITRSSVNAWEIGISVPSTQYVIEFTNIFNVSSYYLIVISKKSTINMEGLVEKEVAILSELIECFRNKKTDRNNAVSLSDFFKKLMRIHKKA